MSCPQIWNIEQEKDREKEKVGGTPAKLKEKKGRKRFKARDKKTQETFFCWKDTYHVVVVQNNGKGMYKKNVLHVQSCFFLLIRPIVVFYRSPALPSPLSITRDHIFLNKLLILSTASLLALAKSIYY